MFDKSILSILICPITKLPLLYREEEGDLVSNDLSYSYKILNSIPILLPEEATKLK